MPILFRKYQNNNAKMTNCYGKYYAKPVVVGTATVEDLCDAIEEKCTVHSADIVAVLRALKTVLKEKIQMGFRVELPGIGAFKPSLRSTGVSNVDEFDAAKHIKRLRIVYTPEKTLEQGHYVTSLLAGAKVREFGSLLPKDVTVTNSGSGSGSGGNGSGNSDPIEDRP